MYCFIWSVYLELNFDKNSQIDFYNKQKGIANAPQWFIMLQLKTMKLLQNSTTAS